ncbi:hypothetical protein [Rothia sp. ZJ932]|uniref:hypothetical protein n=1 Tax=Rothia sp. ZJ932 TaxID=2810516 RepID=UPI001967DAFB|nr:hypothetical protein [Rothia sp. ZJ932]QRZ61763.1 hypothetical protein JR346_01065 [Rothia sp. ZJ932]
MGVIPFGAIAEGGSFEYGDSHWELRGLQESYDAAEAFTVGTSSVKIPPIQAMMVLKIIAWGERTFPTDCTDFYHLLVAACKIADEDGTLRESEMWDSYTIVELCEGNPQLIAAVIQSQRLRNIFEGEAADRCREILSDIDARENFIAMALREQRDETVIANDRKLCEAFITGLELVS